MDFRKLEYFLKTAEKLNFTEAAKNLYISPQALTQQIAQLEQELGTKLFQRNTRRVSLTMAGLFCYQKFSPVKTAYEQALMDVTAKLSEQNHIIRVGFFHGLPKNEIVTPWLNTLQAQFPDTEFEIISADLGTTWRYLDEEKLDICLTNVDSYFPLRKYRVCKLVTAPAQIVVSLNHPWAVKDYISASDLKQGEMLQLHNAYPTSAPGFYDSVQCHTIHRIADFDAMLATLEGAKYFAVFPSTFEFREHARFKYFPLPAEYEFSFFTICAIQKPAVNEKVNHLFEFIEKNYQVQLDNL